MAEVVSLADRINVTGQPDAPERPPKITQAEADYQLARGPYAARLAAARRTLEIAMRFSDEESAFLFPVGHVDNLKGSVLQKETELKEFEQTSGPDRSRVTIAKKAVAAALQVPVASSEPSQSDERITDTARLQPIDEIGVRFDAARHTELTLLTDEPDEHWQDRALCSQTDPEAYFPDKGQSTKEAKKVCLACEVRDECLEAALVNDERFGVWGGLSERERRKLKKRNAASKSA